MGYYMHTGDIQFTIKKENFQRAFEALKKAALRSWIDESYLSDPKATLKDALECCRWTPLCHAETGDIINLEFTGEKLGDEDLLFQAIAPFVEAGSYITVYGEEDSIWRWEFDGKRVCENTPYLDFDGHTDMIRAILEQKEILPTLLGIHPQLDKKIAKALR